MKAFLSHSSKDKAFVGSVASAIGRTLIEYDEWTLEYTLNTDAIRRALARSDLFVLFLSNTSVNSAYVAEEIRAALERRGAGLLKQVLIFAIDATSYRALPGWLREVNIVQQLTSPKACARKIQSRLLELGAQDDRNSSLYLGREDEEKALRKAISVPPKNTPISIHAVGHHGIGRKTFVRNSLSKFYPRYYDVFVEISLSDFQGIEDLYRALYELHVASSLEEMIRDYKAFAELAEPEQIRAITEIINEMAERGEFILVNDDDGVYNDEGDYHSHIKKILAELQSQQRPVIGFIQTRMMPLSRRTQNPRSYHTFLKPLKDADVRELLGLSMQQLGIDYTTEDVNRICDHLDGHPYNVRFALQFISDYGIQALVNDPSDLIEWKQRRAEDFLKRIKFSQLEVDLIAILYEYRYVATEMLLAIVKADLAEIAKSLRRLEEFCCVERREPYYHLSAPIREAIRRDKRFDKTPEWLRVTSNIICGIIKDYQNDDAINIPILSSALTAIAQGAVAPKNLSALILPSHLLQIAKDCYDRGRRPECLEFCRRAYSMKNRLANDVKTEVLRLWGLSAVRLNDQTEFNYALSELKTLPGKPAQRIRYFLEGFNARIKGLLDAAEHKFRKAWELSPDNQSVNRELASLYCKQKRYNDAEAHARSVYRIAPTNPYSIDILAETLLGKLYQGLPIDASELNRLFDELRIYGDAPGSSFYQMRDAQRKWKDKDFGGALKSVAKAIERTPSLVSAYFLRADVHLSLGNVVSAERDLKEINELLDRAGGFSEGEEAQVHELEIRILMEKRQYQAAHDKIERSAFLPATVAKRLKYQLANAIAFVPDGASAGLRDWAKAQLKT